MRTTTVAAAPARTQVACSIVTDPTRIDALAHAWHALLQRSETNEPMLGPTWLGTWWHIFGGLGGRELRLVLVHEGDQLIGLAPMLLRSHWHRGLIPLRRLEPLGSGEPVCDAICSDYLNVIAARGSEAKVADAVAAVLVKGDFGQWHEHTWPLMDGSSAMTLHWKVALEQRGLEFEQAETEVAPHIPLPDSWDGYIKALRGSRRYFLTRSLKDFERWANGTARLHVVESPEDLEKGEQILIELHRERWRGTLEGGVFRSPRFLAFQHAVLPRLLAEGSLELMWLEAHGKPVAALYNLVWGTKTYFYQCGRATRVPPHVRPGITVLAYALRRSIAFGRREFDFLAGRSRYKTQLALAERPIVSLRALRPGWRQAGCAWLEHALRGPRALRRAWRGHASGKHQGVDFQGCGVDKMEHHAARGLRPRHEKEC